MDESSFSTLNIHLLSLPGGAQANRLFYLAAAAQRLPRRHQEHQASVHEHQVRSKRMQLLLNLPLLLIWKRHFSS